VTPTEQLAAKYGVPPLVVLEEFLERASIREYQGGYQRNEAEALAIEDTEQWLKLWISTKISPDSQQPVLRQLVTPVGDSWPTSGSGRGRPSWPGGQEWPCERVCCAPW
jgi:hypothetical protein